MTEPSLSRAFPRETRQSAAQPNDADPLAELARIVGHDDPFHDILGEAHRAARHGDRRPYETSGFDNPDLGHGYQTAPGAYETAYYDNTGNETGYTPLSDEAEYYDEETELGPDISLKKRRGGLIAAGLVTLAVLGGAGFAYYKGGSSPVMAGNPPVIHADPGPTKTVPEKTAEAPQHSKLIYDRVGGTDKPGDEKVVSRTEEPVDLPEPPTGAAIPSVAANDATSAIPASPALAGASGDAVAPVGTPAPGEPRKVRTVLIRPDGTAGEPDMALPPVASPAAPGAQAAAQPSGYSFSIIENDDLARPSASAAAPAPLAPAALPRPAAQPTSTLQRSAPAAAVAPVRPAPAAVQRPAATTPPAPRPIAQAAAPQQRVASLPSPAAPVASSSTARLPAGSYTVQLTSQRSEQDARAAFAGLQKKFPSVLGARQPSIQKADLGARGTYYRVKVVAGSRDAAAQLCSSLKAAGGDCVVGN